jgi:small nuclear ribonucleoprotein (snRNP)-like protein
MNGAAAAPSVPPAGAPFGTPAAGAERHGGGGLFAPLAPGAELAASDPSIPSTRAPAADDPDLPVPYKPAGGRGPLFVAGENRVAVHTNDGRSRRGVLRDADLALPEVALHPQGRGPPEVVTMSAVKAIFFMGGSGEGPQGALGPRLKVSFKDGRIIEGRRQGVDTALGFFLVLGDSARNSTNLLFVARAATLDVVDL